MLDKIKVALDTALNLAVTEPALLMTALQTILALITTLGLGLSTDWTGGILTLAAAVLSAIPGLLARPVQVSAITGLVAAAVTALIAFGVPGIPPGLVAALNAAIVAVMAIILRSHVTTLATLRAQQSKTIPPAAPARLT